ncbi:hypothetical protein [Streptomyces sp. NPDC093984]|uniref:hypothetical protein n=1 Tax=Streptomyces sp. NPDC093984 TaxID=3366052 RepID=UPI0038054838
MPSHPTAGVTLEPRTPYPSHAVPHLPAPAVTTAVTLERVPPAGSAHACTSRHKGKQIAAERHFLLVGECKLI